MHNVAERYSTGHHMRVLVTTRHDVSHLRWISRRPIAVFVQSFPPRGGCGNPMGGVPTPQGLVFLDCQAEEEEGTALLFGTL